MANPKQVQHSFYRRFIDFFRYWYFQYTLNTAVYMLEPLEIKIVNSIFVATVAIFLYSTYVFLPGHAVMMLHFFEYILGSDSSVPQDKVS